MEFIATQKYLIESPKKIRETTDLIKGLKPKEALEKLPFIRKKAVQPLIKVIKAAIANAGQKGIPEAELVFKEIQIGEGPRLKRGRPVSRGRWHPYKKRMSHIRVVLAAPEKPKNLKTEELKKGEKNGTKG